MSDHSERIEKAIRISANLSPEEHERICAIMVTCIGEKEFLFFGQQLRKQFLVQSGLPTFWPALQQEKQIVAAMASLSATLMSLYLQGSIVFRDPDEKKPV